jgi:hypothetical protein
VAVVLDLMIHDIDLVRTSWVGLGGGVVPVLTPSWTSLTPASRSIHAVANITASRVSRERMRKLRIFQQSGYLSPTSRPGPARSTVFGATWTSRRSSATRGAQAIESRSSAS